MLFVGGAVVGTRTRGTRRSWSEFGERSSRGYR